MYSDQQMLRLAQNYLQKVGEFRGRYPSAEHLLQHCKDVYEARKEVGLEPTLNEEEECYE